MKTYLIEENLGFPQDVLEFRQLQEVPLKGFGVLVHLTEFVFKLLERCLMGLKHFQLYGLFSN